MSLRFLKFLPPRKDGGGVVLELLDEAHVREFYHLAMVNRDHIRPWMSWLNDDFSYETVIELIRNSRASYHRGEGCWMGIRLSTGILAGCAIFSTLFQMQRCAEISYWLDERQQGKGLAQRACRSLIEHAFNARNLERIDARCHCDNERSRAVVATLGFRETALQKMAERRNERWHDIIVYSLERSAWEERLRAGTELPEALPILARAHASARRCGSIPAPE